MLLEDHENTITDRSNASDRQRETRALPVVSWFAHASTQGHARLLECASREVEKGDSPVALHVGDVKKFRPVGNKLNVLAISTGLSDFPEEWIPLIRQSDAILCPSAFCFNLLIQVTDVPLFQFEVVSSLKYEMRSGGDWICVFDETNYPIWPLVLKGWIDGIKQACTFVIPGREERTVTTHGHVSVVSGSIVGTEFRSLIEKARGVVYLPGTNDGSGILARQLKNCGKPVLTTVHGGHAREDWRWSIDYDLVRTPLGGFSKSVSEDGKYSVAIPRIESLRRRIRLIEKDYEKYLSRCTRSEAQSNLAHVIRDEIFPLL